MQTILEKETDVDLVVFSGDMLSGWLGKGVPGWVQNRWNSVIAAAVTKNLRYAIVLGNHDPEADLSRRGIVDLDMQQPLSLTQAGPTSVPGASNYWLPILSRDGSKREAARIWMLDSEPVHCGTIKPLRVGCCEHQMPHWLAKHVLNSSALPSIAFVHVPFPQYMYLWNSHPTLGHKQEAVCCMPQSHCLFESLKKAGVKAVYCGHDHNNNYHGIYQGVRLAYGHKTGYGSYGPPKGCLRGARVLLLQEGADPTKGLTWIRLEDGSLLHQSHAHKSSLWRKQYMCST